MDCQPSTKNEVMHFVMANIEGFYDDVCCHQNFHNWYTQDDMYLAPTYLNLLFRMENDTLHIIDTLNINPAGKFRTDNIIHVKNGKWIYLSEKSRYNKEDYPDADDDWVTVFDYSNIPFIKRRFIESSDGQRFLRSFTSGFQTENRTTLINKVVGSDILIWFYMNNKVEYNEINVQKPVEFGHFSTGGYSNIETNHSVNRYWLDTLGNLALRWQKLGPGVKPPSAPFKVPEQFLNPKYHNFFKLVINNGSSDWMVGRGGKGVILSDTLIVYNKKSKKWSQSIKFPEFFSLDIYKDFIYGTEADFNSNLDSLLTPDILEESISDFNRRGSNKYSQVPFMLDHTGKLFIYHIPTKKMIEWDNKDLDSEMLTVKDGWIYYRVFDEIRKVPLNEKKVKIVWDKQEVVIKNIDVIPHVHNIFWAPKTDHIVEEWITPKPEKKKSKGLPKRINN